MAIGTVSRPTARLSLIAELILQCQTNYRECNDCHEDCVGGNYCWSWAWFFKNGIDALPNMKCGFQATVRRIWDDKEDPVTGLYNVHYAVQLTMGPGGEGCSSWFDDGFTRGQDMYHPGIFPNGWKLEGALPRIGSGDKPRTKSLNY